MITKNEKGYDINGIAVVVKSENPCAYCDIVDMCDDEVNVFCKTQLKANEYFIKE